MKRILLLLPLCLLLTACWGKEPTADTYEVERDGVTYTVDQQNGTISDGEHLYRFDVSGGGTDAAITYPDGSTYWRSYSGSGYVGGWSDDYREDKYVSGDILMDIFGGGNPAAKSSRSGNPLLGILLLAIGLFNAITPQTAWYLSHGWRYKNAEPSEAALFFARGGGILAILIGLLQFFV